MLWEVEREELGEPQQKQSFVDLGCGNGLLVYLLASEGVSGRGGMAKEGGGGRGGEFVALCPQHPGKGIDLQRRKVWQRFQPPAILEVRGMGGVGVGGMQRLCICVCVCVCRVMSRNRVLCHLMHISSLTMTGCSATTLMN